MIISKLTSPADSVVIQLLPYILHPSFKSDLHSPLSTTASTSTLAPLLLHHANNVSGTIYITSSPHKFPWLGRRQGIYTRILKILLPIATQSLWNPPRTEYQSKQTQNLRTWSLHSGSSDCFPTQHVFKWIFLTGSYLKKIPYLKRTSRFNLHRHTWFILKNYLSSLRIPRNILELFEKRLNLTLNRSSETFCSKTPYFTLTVEYYIISTCPIHK